MFGKKSVKSGGGTNRSGRHDTDVMSETQLNMMEANGNYELL
jgi:hypothetical protein